MPLNLYFAPHTEEAFTENLGRLFSTAKILVFEKSFTNGPLEDFSFECELNSLSTGDLTPRSLMMRVRDRFSFVGYTERLWGMIYRSQKVVCVERSPTPVSDMKDLLLISLTPCRGLDDLLKRYETGVNRLARFETGRDEAFASQLRELCADNPDTEILAIRGPSHQRGLEKFLRDAGVPFSSLLSQEPMTIDMQNELVSRLEVGEVPNRKTLMMTLISQCELWKDGDFRKLRRANYVEVARKLESMSENEMEDYLKKQFDEFFGRTVQTEVPGVEAWYGPSAGDSVEEPNSST